jgi:hypothetical protein
LESAWTESLLVFKTAEIELRNLFSLPLDLAYFIGESDQFGSGKVFAEKLGAVPLASRYPGYAHFWDSRLEYKGYEGIHTPRGTGIELDYWLHENRALLALYAYQDGRFDADPSPTVFELDPGHWSMDLRAALSFSSIKLEAFAGATYPTPDASYGYLRGGLLFYAADKGVEFLAQIGLPRWAPGTDTFDIGLLYLLVEPRLRLGVLSVIPTFFWRPSYYLLTSTGEQAFDINLDLAIGKPEEWPLAGGLESNFVYQTEKAGALVNEFRIKITPYVQFLSPGVVWEVRMNTNVWPFDAGQLLELLLVVKAEF